MLAVHGETCRVFKRQEHVNALLFPGNGHTTWYNFFWCFAQCNISFLRTVNFLVFFPKKKIMREEKLWVDDDFPILSWNTLIQCQACSFVCETCMWRGGSGRTSKHSTKEILNPQCGTEINLRLQH